MAGSLAWGAVTGMAMKMSAGGYSTHMFGKWDVGSAPPRLRSSGLPGCAPLKYCLLLLFAVATPDHTPHGRGYSTGLHYYHHCNDYWNYVDGMKCKQSNGDLVSVVDLWQTNLEQANLQGPAHGYNNTCAGGMGNSSAGRASPADHGSSDRVGDTCTRIGPKSDHWCECSNGRLGL